MITHLALALHSFLVSAAPLELRSGAPVNNITVGYTGSLCVNQTVNITWTGSEVNSSPFSLRLGEGGYYTGVRWYDRWDDINDMWYKYQVGESAGESLVFEVIDATGEIAYAQNLRVQPVNSSECSTSNHPSTTTSEGEDSSGASENASDDAAVLITDPPAASSANTPATAKQQHDANNAP